MKRVGMCIVALVMLGGTHGSTAFAQSKGARAQSKAAPAVTQVRVFEGMG